MSEPVQLLHAGQLLAGTYRIVRFMGRGGMGEVYEAAHERLSGRYAVKLLLRDFGANEDVLRRFKQEADVTSRLRHPNIVQVIDFAQLPDGTPYMVMEFLEGRDLADELRQVSRMTPMRAADIVEQVAAGLEAAHAEGVVHRDLKPANVYLTTLKGQGRELAKIVDFGISKVRAATANLTQTQAVIGTPQYMSPEQARGQARAVDARTDQFALGAIAYELLAGQPAFHGDTVASVIYQVVHEPAADLIAMGVITDARLDAVVRRAMAKEPADRWASVSEFAREFRQATHGDEGSPRVGQTRLLRTESIAAAPAKVVQTTFGGTAAELTPNPGARGRITAAAAAATAIVVLGAGITWRWRHQAPAPHIAAPITAPAPAEPSPHAATVTITVNGPPGLTATIDGVERALPLVLPRGAVRKVVFAAPGHVPDGRSIKAQDDSVIDLDLQKAPAAGVERTNAPAQTPPRRERTPKRREPNVVTDL